MLSSDLIHLGEEKYAQRKRKPLKKRRIYGKPPPGEGPATSQGGEKKRTTKGVVGALYVKEIVGHYKKLTHKGGPTKKRARSEVGKTSQGSLGKEKEGHRFDRSPATGHTRGKRKRWCKKGGLQLQKKVQKRKKSVPSRLKNKNESSSREKKFSEMLTQTEGAKTENTFLRKGGSWREREPHSKGKNLDSLGGQTDRSPGNGWLSSTCGPEQSILGESAQYGRTAWLY